MPHTDKKRSGKSLRERAAIARRLTAEQQDAAAVASEQRRSARFAAKEERAAQSRQSQAVKSKRETKSKSGAKASSKSGRTSGTKKLAKRNAKEERVEKPKRSKSGRKLPTLSIGLGARIVIALVCAVAVCAALLYPVGQTYYQTVRGEQRLQAELDAVSARNEKISEQNKALETDEGVENQARSEFGWTKEGESVGVVTNADDKADASTTLPEQIDGSKIKAPQTWYYDILDKIFFYDNS